METSSAFFYGNLQRLFSSRPKALEVSIKKALEVSIKKAPGCHPEAKFNWTS